MRKQTFVHKGWEVEVLPGYRRYRGGMPRIYVILRSDGRTPVMRLEMINAKSKRPWQIKPSIAGLFITRYKVKRTAFLAMFRTLKRVYGEVK